MNKNYESVLAILRTALFQTPLSLPEDVDWPEVYRELQQQAVVNLPAGILTDLPGLPENLRMQWSYSAIKSMQRFYHILQEQADAIALLQSAGIKTVVLKGTAAAMYYPNPDYRSMGDVDLLVEKGKADAALEIMLGNGYELSADAFHAARHFVLNKNQVAFELHSRFEEIADSDEAGVLDGILFDGMHKSHFVEIAGINFLCLPNYENGLVLLEHAKHHITNLGLRHVIDWVMYASVVVDDEMWYGLFQSVAQKCGLEKFATVMMRMAQLYLGAPTFNHTWCAGVDELLCENLLTYVMDNGNFGVKRGQHRAVVRNLSEYGSVKEGFQQLQKTGMENFGKTIERYPVLRYGAWLLRIGQMIVRGVKIKVGFSELCQSFRESRGRVKLFEQLGLRETKRGNH